MLLSLSAAAFAQNEPNVLLVILDDVGVDKLVRYQADLPGYAPAASTVPVTPMIDALIDDGVRFRQAWSNPMCSPTRAGILTGRYAYRTGVGYVANEGFPTGHLLPSETTLAEALDPIYTTALFGKWHLGDEGLDADGDDDPDDWYLMGTRDAIPNPNLHGFEVFDGSLWGSVFQYLHYRKIAAYDYGYDAAGDEHSSNTWQTTYATEQLIDDASTFLVTAPEPFFGMIAFQAAHDADPGYDPAHAWQGCSTITTTTSDAEVYRAMIECADFHLERLLADLDAVGRLDDTLIFFVADNGPVPAITDPGFPHWLEGKGSAYEAGVRVPFVVTEGKHLDATPYGYTFAGTPFAPGDRVQVGRALNRLVGTVDLYDTILDFAGLPQTGEDSVSFRPLLLNPTGAGRTSIVTELYDDVQDLDGVYDGVIARRGPRYKLVVNQHDDGTPIPCQTMELYDLVADRAEANDLASTAPFTFVRDAFRAELDQLVDDWEADAANPPHWLWTVADGPRTTGACP